MLYFISFCVGLFLRISVWQRTDKVSVLNLFASSHSTYTHVCSHFYCIHTLLWVKKSRETVRNMAAHSRKQTDRDMLKSSQDENCMQIVLLTVSFPTHSTLYHNRDIETDQERRWEREKKSREEGENSIKIWQSWLERALLNLFTFPAGLHSVKETFNSMGRILRSFYSKMAASN